MFTHQDVALIEEIANAWDTARQPYTFEAVMTFLEKLRSHVDSELPRDESEEAKDFAKGLIQAAIITGNPKDPFDNRMRVYVKDPNEKPEKEEETLLKSELQARANYNMWAKEDDAQREYNSDSTNVAIKKFEAFSTWKADMMVTAVKAIAWHWTNNIQVGDGLQFTVSDGDKPERVTVTAAGGEDGDFKLDHHNSSGSFNACYVGQDRFFSTLDEYLHHIM